jgi:uncharacterized protein (DUF1697 family)
MKDIIALLNSVNLGGLKKILQLLERDLQEQL